MLRMKFSYAGKMQKDADAALSDTAAHPFIKFDKWSATSTSLHSVHEQRAALSLRLPPQWVIANDSKFYSFERASPWSYVSLLRRQLQIRRDDASPIKLTRPVPERRTIALHVPSIPYRKFEPRTQYRVRTASTVCAPRPCTYNCHKICRFNVFRGFESTPMTGFLTFRRGTALFNCAFVQSNAFFVSSYILLRNNILWISSLF